MVKKKRENMAPTDCGKALIVSMQSLRTHSKRYVVYRKYRVYRKQHSYSDDYRAILLSMESPLVL